MDHGCWLLVVSCWLLVVSCWLLVVSCWLFEFQSLATNNKQQTTNNYIIKRGFFFEKGPLFNLRKFRKSIDKKKRRGYNNIRFAKISQICRHLFFVGCCWLCVVCHYPPSNKQRATNNCQRLLFYFKLFDSIRAFLITVDRQPLTVNRQLTTNNQQPTTSSQQPGYTCLSYIFLCFKKIYSKE